MAVILSLKRDEEAATPSISHNDRHPTYRCPTNTRNIRRELRDEWIANTDRIRSVKIAGIADVDVVIAFHNVASCVSAHRNIVVADVIVPERTNPNGSVTVSSVVVPKC